jgi:molybdopterin molybdotransferase
VFGQFRGVPFLGLPGNPVSAFVAFEVFGRDAVGRLAGLAPTVRPRVRVRIENEVTSDGRESYLRAVVTQRDGEFVGSLTGHQGSGNLLSLVQANALLIIPAGVKCLPAGREVDAWMI